MRKYANPMQMAWDRYNANHRRHEPTFNRKVFAGLLRFAHQAWTVHNWREDEVARKATLSPAECRIEIIDWEISHLPALFSDERRANLESEKVALLAEMRMAEAA